MLTQEENSLLTRVTGIAPMGMMMKAGYWIPAVRAARLLPDGDPLPVRLFGEDFVAFRTTDGTPGFLDERCPHRGASLLLGRNEECGLRCIFHGWKFGPDGAIMEAPTSPDGGRFLIGKTARPAYPTREAGGILWVWLGKDEPAPFPDFPFTHLPAENVYIGSTLLACNYAQVLEGTLDSSHIGFLHRDLIALPESPHGQTSADLAPRFEIFDADHGFSVAALRQLDGGRTYARLTEFVLPFHCSAPAGPEDEGSHQMLVPIDDEHVLWFIVRWHDKRPFDPTGMNLAAPDAPIDNLVPLAVGREKRWGQDREAMRQGSFSGFSAGGFLAEDAIIELSMGAIVDRTRELLDKGDLAVVRMRKLLLSAARGHAAKNPVQAKPRGSPHYAAIRGGARTLEPGQDWRTEFGITARVG